MAVPKNRDDFATKRYCSTAISIELFPDTFICQLNRNRIQFYRTVKSRLCGTVAGIDRLDICINR